MITEKGTLGKGTVGKGTLGSRTLAFANKGTVGSVLFLIAITMFSLQTFAAESLLLTTFRSDNPSEITTFKLVTSESSDLVGFKMDDEPLITIAALSKGVTTQDGYVPIPFRGKRYRRFVILKAAGPMSLKNGGLIDIFYLSNALTNSFSSMRFSLERIGSKWALYTNPNADHRAFNTLHFVIGKLGINDVKASHKNAARPEFLNSEFAFQEL